MISYMQGTKFFKKPVISKSVIHKTVMDKDFLYPVEYETLKLGRDATGRDDDVRRRWKDRREG